MIKGCSPLLLKADINANPFNYFTAYRHENTLFVLCISKIIGYHSTCLSLRVKTKILNSFLIIQPMCCGFSIFVSKHTKKLCRNRSTLIEKISKVLCRFRSEKTFQQEYTKS
jgi:hypothetical protein